ncbi:MAG: hypothetical protein AW07_04714 [Candidatus Accumulibacter sp. SK-11]|nr:MAG: hypothetical protein AW07_04714 [Candidatus Accumulibacter sp. SK-11]
MQHEALAVLAGQRVDDLLVAAGTERRDDDRLRFPAREQGGAMRPRQDAGADGDRPDGARVAAIDSRLAGQDAAADDACLDRVDHPADGIGVGRVVVGGQRLDGIGRDLLDPLRAQLLAGDPVSLFEFALHQPLELAVHRLVPRGRGPVPLRFAGLVGQFVDRLDCRLHLLVAEDDGAKHDILGKLHGFRLDHQHGRPGPRDNQIEPARLELGAAWVEDILIVNVADAGGADRSIERDSRNRQCRRGADQRRYVGVDLRVERHHHRDDLDLVVEAFREQRAQRAIDQTRGQRLLLGGAAFALEEATGNSSGGVGLFDVVDGQREEILPRFGRAVADDGDQNHRLAHRDQYGAASLARDLPGFQRYLMRAVGEALLDDIKHFSLSR